MLDGRKPSKLLSAIIGLMLVFAIVPKKALAEPLPPGISEHFVKLNNGRLVHAYEAGSPSLPPAVFLHGSPGDARDWMVLLTDHDLQHSFHLIAVDRPGFGLSGASVASVAGQANLVRAALSFNKSGKPALVVGYSYAGAVAARWSMDHPEDIAGILFVAASVDPDLVHPRTVEELTQIEWLEPYLWSYWVSEGAEAVTLPNDLKQMLPLWPRIRVPIIAIQGSADHSVNPKTADFLKLVLINAPLRLHLVPGLDHLVLRLHPRLIKNDLLVLKTMIKQ